MFYVLAALLIVVAAVLWFSSQQFEKRIDGLKDRVLAAAAMPATPDLPQIVRDFAERNGGSVAAGPRSVHLRHRASLTTAKGKAPIAITADQWLAIASTEMVWRGRGAMMGLPVTVVDSIVGGEGLLEARVLGVVSVAKGTGPDFAKGELQRYLSELPVHPDAILSNASLRWRQIDAATVEVTARFAGGEASIRFSFNEDGDITGMLAPDRPMTAGDHTEPTAWRGSFGGYQWFGSRRIPTDGEVGWELPDGLFTYWTGKIVDYELL